MPRSLLLILAGLLIALFLSSAVGMIIVVIGIIVLLFEIWPVR